MKTETVKIDQLNENPDNPRRHGGAQLNAMKQSVKNFGVYRPIVVDENNMILVGHGIFTVLKELGHEKVSVYRIPSLSESQKKKLLISDNKISEMGTTDFTIVESLIKEIGDFEIPGFDPDILNMILEDGEKTLESIGNISSEDSQVKEGSSDVMGGFSNDSMDSDREKEFSKSVEGSLHGKIANSVNRTVTCPHCGKEFSV